MSIRSAIHEVTAGGARPVGMSACASEPATGAALIVGGDRVGAYRDYLLGRGFGRVRHWDGRRGSDARRDIPCDTVLLVIIVDQVNHSLATRMRRLAKERGLAVVFSRRCVAELQSALSRVCAPATCQAPLPI